MITNIKIKNIKGYGDPATSIDIELKTNRVNIIHAPNGTGKSSLAMAFGSLQKKSLAVAKDNKYHKDETLPSELCITMDGSTFMANDVSNTISPVLDCTVINCATLVSTTQHNRGQYTNVYGYLDIKDIEIASKIPVNVIPNYQISTIRTQYNVNGKILPNLNFIFSRRDFYKCC